MDNTGRVIIKTKDVEMASVIGQHTKEQILSLLKRMDIYMEESWEKEVLATYLRDEMIARPEFLLMFYQKEMIYFLLGIWESEKIDLNSTDWAVISQLKLLGLIDYSQADFESKRIHIVKEAKENLYFYLKSKSAKRLLEKYDQWECILRGMLTYYGMISFQRLYFIFCKQFLEPIDDRQLHLFLSVRISLFFFGTFVMEKHSNMEYYQNYEVTDPESVFEKILKNYDMKYRIPKMEEFIFVGENNGLGRWEGISELADILLNQAGLEYHRVVILVKSAVLYVQNGDDLEKFEEQFFEWCEEVREYGQEITASLRLLYDSVPVYDLKGWTRKERREIRPKTPEFKVLHGGKKKGGDPR